MALSPGAPIPTAAPPPGAEEDVAALDMAVLCDPDVCGVEFAPGETDTMAGGMPPGGVAVAIGVAAVRAAPLIIMIVGALIIGAPAMEVDAGGVIVLADVAAMAPTSLAVNGGADVAAALEGNDRLGDGDPAAHVVGCCCC